jgi:hypothetical protein
MYSEWVSVSGSQFLVRGLKTSEWVDFVIFRESTDMRVGNEALVKVAKLCTEDWRNVLDEDGETLPFNRDLIDFVPLETLRELGEYSLNTLSSLSEEDERRYKGFVRWSMWLSDEKNKNKAKEFECKSCIEMNRWESKRCGLTQDRRDSIVSADSTEDEDAEVAHSSSQIASSENLSKFKARRSNKQTYHYNKAEEKKSIESNLEGWLLSGTKHFRFPECPVSWIPVWMRTVAEMLLYCEQKDISFFEGGVENQFYKSYLTGRVVISEYNRIENEKHDEKK